MSIPATPARAITSILSNRSAPSIPPASQTYEPLVKAVLRQRLLYYILLPAFAYTWLLANMWSVWSQGGMAHIGIWATVVNSVRPLTWIYAISMWLLGAVTAIILSNRFLSAAPTPASSPSKIFHSAFAKRSTSYALMTYISSALLLGVLHTLMATIYERDVDPRLTVFVKSKKHPLYLNGRTIYLMSSQALLGCAYLVRTILLDKFSVRWKEVFSSPGLPPAERGSRRLANMLTTFASVSLFVVLCSTLHAVLFGFARSVVLPVLYLLPFVSQILRPFTAHFLRGSFTLTLLFRQWPLICRTFYLAMTTVACWETAESPLFSGINVANSAADPALALVSGITSSDGCFKHFAYAELQQLASENSPTASARRTELFSDQKYNPTMWSTLVREALLTLGKDYQLLLRRGQPEAPPAPPANPPLAVPAEVKPVPLIRTSVLKATSASPLRAALDSLASDGPISTVVGSTADAGVSHIPELFQSVLHASPGGDRAIEAVKKSEEQMVGLYEQTKVKWQGGLGGILRRNAPAQVIEVVGLVEEWWTRDRVNKAVEMALPNRHLDVLAISVLCNLICASLAEDKYGVVQRDIPRMLEALVSFLVATEEYQAEISRKYNVSSEEDMKKLPEKERTEKERLAFEVANAGEVLNEVSNVLKDGIMQVVRTFGDKLAAFKFPLRTAKKLQTFVDYA